MQQEIVTDNATEDKIRQHRLRKDAQCVVHEVRVEGYTQWKVLTRTYGDGSVNTGSSPAFAEAGLEVDSANHVFLCAKIVGQRQ